jgi:hypothetical protein
MEPLVRVKVLPSLSVPLPFEKVPSELYVAEKLPLMPPLIVPLKPMGPP